MFYWSDLQLEVFGWLMNSLGEEEKPPEYAIPKYFTGRAHGITETKSGLSLGLGWRAFSSVVSEALSGGRKGMASIDGDPEKSFCSKIHVHPDWCISFFL